MTKQTKWYGLTVRFTSRRGLTPTPRIINHLIRFYLEVPSVVTDDKLALMIAKRFGDTIELN